MNLRIRSGFFLVLLAALSAPARGRTSRADLVADGGFEGGGAFALSAHWSVRAEEEGAVLRDTAHLRNGRASLCLRHRTPTSYSWARQNRIHVPPNSKLIVRCWVRGEKLVKGDGSAGARIYLEDPRSQQQIASLKLSVGTFKWTEFTLGPVATGDRESVNVILYLHKCTGAIWFDDLTISVETPDEQARRRRAPLRNLLRADIETVRGRVEPPQLQERLGEIEARVDATTQFADQLDFPNGPPYTPLHEQVYSVMGAHLAANGPPRLAVARANPWVPFSPLGRPRESPSTAVEVLMARGEREQIALNLTACWRGQGREPVAVRILPEPLPGLRPLQVTHVLLRDGHMVPDPLPPLARQGADTWRMSIHPGQTRQLWIDVDSANLPPGTHRRTIRFSVGTRGLEVDVPLEVRVLPLQMPQEMPLASYVYWWDYDASGTERDMRMMDQYHVNTVFVKVRPARYPFWDAQGVPLAQDFPNISRNRAMRKAQRVIVWMIAVKWARARDLKDPTAVGAYKAWMRRVLNEFERAGVPRDKLVFYLVDEPHGTDAAALVAGLGRIIHEIDPSLKIWANPYHHTSREDLAVMALEVGVWAPNVNWLVAAPENLGFFRRGGREVWTYAPIGRGSDPLSEYRMMFWRALRRRLKGAGFFCWDYRSGRVWNDFDGDEGDWSVVYEPAPWAPGRVTSKRWEAWREGAEDAMLHSALSRALSATKGRPAADLRQWLRSVPERVTSAKPESRADVILKTREEMLRALAGLENGRPLTAARDAPEMRRFDVTAHGAVGDGVTDDRAAIQKAVDAAGAAGGGEVFFTERGMPYLVGGAVLVRASHVHLSGYGATLKLKDHANDGKVTHVIEIAGTPDGRIADVAVYGLTVDANTHAQAEAGNPRAIYVSDAEDVIIRDVRIIRPFVGLTFGQGSRRCAAIDCVVSEWAEDAFNVDAHGVSGGAREVWFIRCRASGSAGPRCDNAWEIEDGAQDVFLIDCLAENAGGGRTGQAFAVRSHAREEDQLTRNVNFVRCSAHGMKDKSFYIRSFNRSIAARDIRMIDCRADSYLTLSDNVDDVQIIGGKYDAEMLVGLYRYDARNTPESVKPLRGIVIRDATVARLKIDASEGNDTENTSPSVAFDPTRAYTPRVALVNLQLGELQIVHGERSISRDRCAVQGDGEWARRPAVPRDGPVVLSVMPRTDLNKRAVTQVAVAFDRPMDGSTISPMTIQIVTDSGRPVPPDSITWWADDTCATLHYGSEPIRGPFRIRVSPDIRSVDGRPLDGEPLGAVNGMPSGDGVPGGAFDARIDWSAGLPRVLPECVGVWHLDEGEGTRAKDASPLGNGGVLKGGAGWVRGVSGTAIDLNGKDAYIEIPGAATLNLRNGTLAFWAYLRRHSGGVGFSRSANWQDSRMTVHFGYPNDGRIHYSVASGKPPGRHKGYSHLTGAALPLNTWCHIAATCDGTTQRVFLNGRPAGSRRQEVFPFTKGARLLIGRTMGLSPDYLDGMVDEVRLYRRALTPDEIARLAKDRSPQPRR